MATMSFENICVVGDCFGTDRYFTAAKKKSFNINSRRLPTTMGSAAWMKQVAPNRNAEARHKKALFMGDNYYVPVGYATVPLRCAKPLKS